MAFITLRQANVVNSPDATIKGSPLSNSEVDNNFANLNLGISDLSNVVTNLSSSEISNGTSNIKITVASGPISVTGNIIPTSDNVFSLGNANFVFSDLFLSGNSLHLGNLVLSEVNGNIALGGVEVLSATEGAVPADGSITTAKIGDLEVTTAKLAANAVTNAKIENSAITNNKLADGAVTTAKIGDLEVTTEKIALTAVGPGEYGNATSIASFIVGVDGRITSASNIAIVVSGGGGSGLFNTAINEAASANVTDSLANVYAAPSTAGKRYVIHSIHVTNIDGAVDTEITGQFVGTTYSNITFATTVPLPYGSSVELLKKPKILQPSDSIQLLANANNRASVTVTIEESDEIEYFGIGVDITAAATPTDLYVATVNSVIESILLSNDDGVLDVKARVVVTDASDVIQSHFAFDLIVPADATIEVLEQPKFIQSGFKVKVEANQADRLEAIIAGKTV